MEAQAWTAIGLLAATLFGALFFLGNRIEALGARLDSRIDGLISEVRARAARMDVLARQVQEQGAELGDRIYELGVKLDDHLRRHAS